MKKKYIIKICLAFFLVMIFNSCSKEEKLHKFSGQTMGTVYSVIIYEPDLQQDEVILLKKKVEETLKDVNKKMNPFDPNSEISKFNNHKSIAPFAISNNFYEILMISKNIYQKSGGVFDPTIAPLINIYGFGTEKKEDIKISQQKIDSLKKQIGFDKINIHNKKLIKQIPNLQLNLSAIAKGWGVDQVAKTLLENNYQNFIVEIGGEVFANGKKKNKEWKLGIDAPETGNLPGEKIQSIIQIKNKGVATSGDYRNYYEKDGKRISHLIDPRNGIPISHNLVSVTIVAENCTYADAIATASIILGDEGVEFVENIKNVEGYFIFRNGDGFEVKSTAGF